MKTSSVTRLSAGFCVSTGGFETIEDGRDDTDGAGEWTSVLRD